jgi:hypothetical protein
MALQRRNCQSIRPPVRDANEALLGKRGCELVRERILFVEPKGERGILTIDQQDWVFALSEAGVQLEVWQPCHWLDGTIESELRARV